MRQAEAGGASSNADPLEVGSSQGGPAPSPDGSGRKHRAHRGGGLQGESRGLRSRAIYGCAYRMSVAEIGKKHLPGAIKVSREASQGGAG